MEYRIGLDIGIGSVGWAVVSAKTETHPARIEDFGTRIFSSGENARDRISNCQDRRNHRGVRRLERRRMHRKELLYWHFVRIGLINPEFNDELAECKNEEIFSLKVKGLSEILTPAEIYRCMVHTCNHRGYRDFYEPTEDDDKEASVNKAAADSFEKSYRESSLRTVSEYLLTAYDDCGKITIRNREGSSHDHVLIRRSLLKEEATAILTAQQRFHPELTNEEIKKTLDIIFRQRDFEDGPGDPNDATRMYHGFLESLGQCTYYKDEKRGFRGTVISDVYAVTNTLSQYRFMKKDTGEFYLDPAVAKELVDTLLRNAHLSASEVKQILKRHGFELCKSANCDDKGLTKAIKYLNVAKNCLGEYWEEYISEDQFNPDKLSQLHKIGELLSKYQTPKRREEEMRKAGIDASVIKAFSRKKLGGTANVSYRYMLDAIQAFLNGDIYGNFQANTVKEHAVSNPAKHFVKLPPSCIDDPELKSNRVVFKSINETRKIVNAIIEIYGSPTEIVVEVANELGRSFVARSKEYKHQKEREKANDDDRKQIAALLNIDVEDVNSAMLERYRLFNEQGGKSVYSGNPLGDRAYVVLNRNKEFEIDHIIPFSLILDNTLQNKALVFAGENQKKGQRTPLMYLGEANEAAKKAFGQL